MKNHTSILILICFALFTNFQENYDYEKYWKDVQKLENNGLTKSALDIVETIYKAAKKNKNQTQRIKALLYKSKYILTLEENAQLKIVSLFKAEIETENHIPSKQLLENILATMYWQYFQQNRWKFYNRTKTISKLDDEDFRTWSLETLFNEVHIYYQRSLQNELLLQQENLKRYQDLLIKTKNSKDFRPTLFDILSHNALSFYKTDENSITQPAYKFEINDTNYMSNGDQFINLDISSKDSLSLKLNALKIYQNLLKFHLKNRSSKAFVTVDIERLKFAHLHATFNDKEAVFLNTLKQNAEALKNSEQSALYNFEVASLYRAQGATYKSEEINSTNRWKLKDAIDLCNTVLKTYPKSLGAEKCRVLKDQILLPNIHLKAERYITPNKASKALVAYKNLHNLNFFIYKITEKQLRKFKQIYNPEKQIEFFNNLDAQHTFLSALKNVNDHQTHSTEIVLPKLKNGIYLIKTDTNTIQNVLGTTVVHVTNMGLVERSSNKRTTYQIINRNNGNPITNAKVELSHTRNGRSEYLTKSFTTDKYGQFHFKHNNGSYYRNIRIKVTRNSEEVHFSNPYIYRAYNNLDTKNKTVYTAHLFTDRSIYRPSQIVYFKGIITETTDKKSKVTPNELVTITLHNVNGEVLFKQELISNEFGSFSGEFVLPNGSLTGQYYIQTRSNKIKNNTHYFSVEDYKSPKFKAEFKAVNETFKINDNITVNGKAMAFAGSAISNAKVVYRVKRKVQYPRWYWWRLPYYSTKGQEITFNETITNDKGEFKITFKAIPDENVSKDNQPIFNYEITADITDINGETRSATSIVNVGYHSMSLGIVSPKNIDKTHKGASISLNANNLNGKTVSVKGSLKIYKLNPPQHILRARPWEAPDYQLIEKTDFKTLFPHDAYNNEDTFTNWTKGKEVFSTNFNTEEDKNINLKRFKRWESGKYIIIAESQDKFGQNVKDETYVSFFSPKDKTVADQQLFTSHLDKMSYGAGENTQLTLGSAAENITVTVTIEKNNKIISTQLIRLNNEKKTISIPVNKNDLGGFVVHCSFAAFNTYTNKSIPINVPYPKTDLQIEASTFRDKLQPGQDETWNFKIKGSKGDKVTAEILASMYDAALDEFKPHQWQFNPLYQPTYYGILGNNGNDSFGTLDFRLINSFRASKYYPQTQYDQLNWFGLYFGQKNYLRKGYTRTKRLTSLKTAIKPTKNSTNLEEVTVVGYEPKKTFANSVEIVDHDDKIDSDENYNNEKSDELSNIQIRKNLNETAFFFPQLQTDAKGNATFSFTSPEALTQWKLQLLAHTKTLESTVAQFETVTQKELMVIPNAPRFLREGDQINISTKIANLTNKALTGTAKLELTDGITGKVITNALIFVERNRGGNPQKSTSSLSTQNFTTNAKSNTQVTWALSIPKGIQAVEYKVIAQAENFSDGEQNILPVLSNRMLVTETLPMWIGSNDTKTFTLDKLALTSPSDQNTSLKNHKLTLEITSNPAWYAVKALPYLMEYPYNCNEQTFSRFYANALARHIVTSNPRIETVFNQWASQDALISNLEKNQELKSLLIEETPWLRSAQSETEQKKRIALLFDLNKMNNELKNTLRKLKNNQNVSGAWAWFNGGHDNRYITQHIIGGFGHLKKLNISLNTVEISQMIQRAIYYLDKAFIKEYNDLKKHNRYIDLSKDQLSYTQLYYLYIRSFFKGIETSAQIKEIIDYYKRQIKKYWLKRSLYAKGLMALTMHRMGEQKTAGKILKSLEENSITSKELGTYWIENTNSWYWYQAPIETQALMIEAFSEIGVGSYNIKLSPVESQKKTTSIIDNLKIWLLKNKQINQWKTTKATTEAVYALLLQDSDWLSVTEAVAIKVGNKTIDPSKIDTIRVEAGTGYFKTHWNGSEIQPQQAKVTLTKNDKGIAWGAMYWQYFEDLDKITSAETPLKLSKKLFLKTNTNKGKRLTEITSESKLNVGNLVTVRITLQSDRNMEFIHLKEMRAAGFEPINVLSQYTWQDGLSYYVSTRDAATNFFIDFLPKGIYVFEYDVRVNNAGNMSNGISTIQSMYAPEFVSHSEGLRVSVD